MRILQLKHEKTSNSDDQASLNTWSYGSNMKFNASKCKMLTVTWKAESSLVPPFIIYGFNYFILRIFIRSHRLTITF